MFLKYLVVGLGIFFSSFQCYASHDVKNILVCSDNHGHTKSIEKAAKSKDIEVCLLNGDIVNSYNKQGKPQNTGHQITIQTCSKIQKANPKVIQILNIGNHECLGPSFQGSIKTFSDFINAAHHVPNLYLLNSHLPLDPGVNEWVFYKNILYLGYVSSDLGKESHNFKKYLPTWQSYAVQHMSEIIYNQIKKHPHKGNRIKKIIVLSHAGTQESQNLILKILKYLKKHHPRIFQLISSGKIDIHAITGHVHSKTVQEKPSFGIWSLEGIRVPYIYPGSFDSVVRTRF